MTFGHQKKKILPRKNNDVKNKKLKQKIYITTQGRQLVFRKQKKS